MIRQQREPAEAKWMMLLLVKEFQDKDYELKCADVFLESVVDNAIYNKFSLLSQWQAISASQFEVNKRMALVVDEDKGLIEYI